MFCLERVVDLSKDVVLVDFYLIFVFWILEVISDFCSENSVLNSCKPANLVIWVHVEDSRFMVFWRTRPKWAPWCAFAPSKGF